MTVERANQTDASVVFDKVSVEFPIYSAHGRSLKRSMLQFTTGGRISMGSQKRIVVSALNNITLTANHGDHIGLIGHNGAGKSTMLRAIAGVYEPVSGTLTVTGRVSSLIDIMLGMDPEATGFENIRLRSLLLGMTDQETEDHLDEIADVTELGDFLEMPVRTYSSGMMLRLAFSVATSVAPDVLLMDEWLSAGDASFLQKAQKRLESLLGRTGVLFLATHSELTTKENCTRALWMEKGEIRSDGTPDEVWRDYYKAVAAAS